MSTNKATEYHKFHHALNKRMQALEEGRAADHKDMMSTFEPGSKAHTFHKRGHESHTAKAAEYSGAADYHSKCMKSEQDSLNKLAPVNISSVAPDHPNLRMVRRYGQPDVPGNVDPELARFFGPSDSRDA